MALIDHPTGGYRFLPGISPYSRGVVSAPGFEIAHVTLERPVPDRLGFEKIREYLGAEGRPVSALCGVELRSPRPFSFEGFAEFNASYAEILRDWGVFVDGVNPVARTNVAPEVAPPEVPSLHGFSYARPAGPGPATFVVAGAGELPEGVLEAGAIIRRGETDPSAIAEKARFVMDLMEARIRGLGCSWDRVTAVDIYTIHPIVALLPTEILGRIGPAAGHGVRWSYSRPPIEEIEYEMDVRGVRAEIRIE
ncbi:2-amino-5-chloromuconate deaminase CnbZ [Tautonia sociabilis]|uniref:RidA family protein n=1 Tax=Tautonia sociabilis TaxID=2080755 RepID=A0A432MJU2_9BACT|nr:RidA family protein [Tautonia sociabilis]RUL87519.1 RidA family protein [Tautonia sociabilis]